MSERSAIAIDNNTSTTARALAGLAALLLAALLLAAPACAPEVAAEESWRTHCRKRVAELRAQFESWSSELRALRETEPERRERVLLAKLATRLRQLDELEEELDQGRTRETVVRGALRALDDRRLSLGAQCREALGEAPDLESR